MNAWPVVFAVSVALLAGGFLGFFAAVVHHVRLDTPPGRWTHRLDRMRARYDAYRRYRRWRAEYVRRGERPSPSVPGGTW